MSVVGLVPWRLVGQEAWRFLENMARGDEKLMKKLESQMAAPLAKLPMTESARPKSKSGWTLKPWVPGQTGKLKHG